MPVIRFDCRRRPSSLVLITPHLEEGDHLRHRQMSALLLIVSSRLAIGLGFLNSKVALWPLAMNFAGPLLRRWSRRAEVSD
jgi:hypothetical protein